MKYHASPHSVLPDPSLVFFNENTNVGLSFCASLSQATGAHARSGVLSTLIYS